MMISLVLIRSRVFNCCPAGNGSGKRKRKRGRSGICGVAEFTKAPQRKSPRFGLRDETETEAASAYNPLVV